MSRRATLKQEDDRDETPRTEKVLTVVSVAFTAALFAYIIWQAYSTPQEAYPEVRVTGTQEAENGDTLVHIALTNAGGVGLLSATVEVPCAEPAPSITFENIPSDAQRVGTLRCPGGTKDPAAEVSAWVEA